MAISLFSTGTAYRRFRIIGTRARRPTVRSDSVEGSGTVTEAKVGADAEVAEEGRGAVHLIAAVRVRHSPIYSFQYFYPNTLPQKTNLLQLLSIKFLSICPFNQSVR